MHPHHCQLAQVSRSLWMSFSLLCEDKVKGEGPVFLLSFFLLCPHFFNSTFFTHIHTRTHTHTRTCTSSPTPTTRAAGSVMARAPSLNKRPPPMPPQLSDSVAKLKVAPGNPESRPDRPPDTNSIVAWFQSDQLPRGTGRDAVVSGGGMGSVCLGGSEEEGVRLFCPCGRVLYVCVCIARDEGKRHTHTCC